MSVSGKAWAKAHPEQHLARNKKTANKLFLRSRAIRNEAKSVPCMDCGNRYPPYVMHFDHVPGRGEKLGSVSDFNQSNVQRLLDEIAKCDVVCANCHAIRTHDRDPNKIID